MCSRTQHKQTCARPLNVLRFALVVFIAVVVSNPAAAQAVMRWKDSIMKLAWCPTASHRARFGSHVEKSWRDQNGADPGPFLEPSSIGTITEGSENGLFFGPAFWCQKTTLELVLGVAKCRLFCFV